jgi:hypothetical protein
LASPPLDGLLVTTDIDEDGWDPNATAKYVGKLGNQHYYAASVSVVDPDEGDLDIGVGFDYYLDHTFSVGGGYGSGSHIPSALAPRSSSGRISPSAAGSTSTTTATESACSSSGASETVLDLRVSPCLQCAPLCILTTANRFHAFGATALLQASILSNQAGIPACAPDGEHFDVS